MRMNLLLIWVAHRKKWNLPKNQSPLNSMILFILWSSCLLCNQSHWSLFFRPCILFFDSLYSSRNHIRVAATLREYLMEEYRVKKVLPADNGEVATGSEWTKLFSKDVMLTACPRVPQQNNAYDCGVYVLQFAESFMKV